MQRIFSASVVYRRHRTNYDNDIALISLPIEAEVCTSSW